MRSPANQVARKPGVLREVVLDEGHRAVFRFGSISLACTVAQSLRATGRTKKGMGWRGMLMNTSFITSQFISEPSA
jgi:hypothetical protein